ncbi:MAG: phosphate signaling complex protein PhoU [Candidatus Puniceispirillales bacterium]
MSEHISSAFDEALNEINTMVLTMGGLALAQLHGVIDALNTKDNAVLEDLIAADAKIDEIEVNLNAKAIETIAVWSPFAEDLRKVFVAIKLAQIIERIGDYAANIAKRDLSVDQTQANEIIDDLREAGGMACAMLVDAIDAYRHLDQDKALSVWNRDVDLDVRHNAINHKLIVAMENKTVEMAAGSQYLFIMKNIERIGDFTTGIAEQVYFQINASQIEDDRPKVGSVGT